MSLESAATGPVPEYSSTGKITLKAVQHPLSPVSTSSLSALNTPTGKKFVRRATGHDIEFYLRNEYTLAEFQTAINNGLLRLSGEGMMMKDLATHDNMDTWSNQWVRECNRSNLQVSAAQNFPFGPPGLYHKEWQDVHFVDEWFKKTAEQRSVDKQGKVTFDRIVKDMTTIWGRATDDDLLVWSERIKSYAWNESDFDLEYTKKSRRSAHSIRKRPTS